MLILLPPTQIDNRGPQNTHSISTCFMDLKETLAGYVKWRRGDQRTSSLSDLCSYRRPAPISLPTATSMPSVFEPNKTIGDMVIERET
jgi:hypothetical protein